MFTVVPLSNCFNVTELAAAADTAQPAVALKLFPVKLILPPLVVVVIDPFVAKPNP